MCIRPYASKLERTPIFEEVHVRYCASPRQYYRSLFVHRYNTTLKELNLSGSRIVQYRSVNSSKAKGKKNKRSLRMYLDTYITAKMHHDLRHIGLPIYERVYVQFTIPICMYTQFTCPGHYFSTRVKVALMALGEKEARRIIYRAY